MANVKYYGEIYNKEIKNLFIEDFSYTTKKQNMVIFRSVALKEIELEKDLYDFSFDELHSIFSFSMGVNTFKQRLNVIKQYIKWAITEGYSKLKHNPFDDIDIDKLANKFLNEVILFHYKELCEIEDFLEPQDAVIIRLLFEGFSGVKYSEIIDLKIEHVDFFNKTATIHSSDGSKRTTSVTSRCLDLIRLANEQIAYSRGGRNATQLELFDRGKVVKIAVMRTDTGNKDPDVHLIYRRLVSISEQFNLDISTKTIPQSGMVYMARNIMTEKNDMNTLQREDAEYIMSKFGFIMESGEVSNQTYLKFKKQFLNVETVNKVYYEDNIENDDWIEELKFSPDNIKKSMKKYYEIIRL